MGTGCAGGNLWYIVYTHMRSCRGPATYNSFENSARQNLQVIQMFNVHDRPRMAMVQSLGKVPR